MGDIAEAMLDGTLCEACGSYIDDDASGYPRYCCDACARDRGAAPARPKKRAATGPMRKADRKWLELAATRPAGGGYPGVQWDMCETAFERLLQLGLVERWTPHNPAHKDRAIATDAGRAKLETTR